MSRTTLGMLSLYIVTSIILIGALSTNYSGRVDIKLSKIKYATEQEELNIERSVDYLSGLLNSPCFRTKIHDPILKEKLFTNHNLNFEVYEGSNTKAFTQVSSNLIHVNRVWYTNATLCMMTSNIAHELGHVIGYDHESMIPQVLGKVVRECCLR